MRWHPGDRRAHTGEGMEEGPLPLRIPCLILVTALAAVPHLLAQGRFEVVGARTLKDAVPRDFYLEGNAVPVEKRNAVLIETPSGARVLAALVVTSGFASRFPQKYSGMLISEGTLSLCSRPLSVGSYGFGLREPAATSNANARFVLYNQAGQKIWECVARKDFRLKEPRPLQAVVDTARLARLYLGRYWIELGP
jgi:hypothetical protein